MKCLELERDADSLSVRARACVGGVRPDADFGVAGLGGARPEHGGGVVRHTDLPLARHGHQPHGAAGRPRHDARRGVAQRERVPALHQRRDVARHRAADDLLALARGGHRAQRVGVRSGAHQRRVADPAGHLVHQPARGRRRREVARRVHGHAPYRARLAVVVHHGLGLLALACCWLGVVDLTSKKRKFQLHKTNP
uniref:Uncharacterized protein n=1 Tax=Zea mays TaxID=4577 RepID=A0A804M0F7_MAIZE